MLQIIGASFSSFESVKAQAPNEIDLTRTYGLELYSQTDFRWSSQLVGVDDKPIGKCGCMISAVATVAPFMLGDPGVTNSAPKFPVGLWTYPFKQNVFYTILLTPGITNSALYYNTINIDYNYYPNYISKYLRDLPIGKGYINKGNSFCNVAFNPIALENIAIPKVLNLGGETHCIPLQALVWKLLMVHSIKPELIKALLIKSLS